MAGNGPPPKDPRRRARSNADPIPLRVLPTSLVGQPDLPEFDVQVEADGELVSQKFVWPERTRQWWQMWADSPLSAEFTATDWSELLDTALLHAQFWTGSTKLAGELRLRVAKFGATPEDRARLRITFAAADEAESKRKPGAAGAGARERYQGLRPGA
jgi:hypothetical protein